MCAVLREFDVSRNKRKVLLNRISKEAVNASYFLYLKSESEWPTIWLINTRVCINGQRFPNRNRIGKVSEKQNIMINVSSLFKQVARH